MTIQHLRLVRMVRTFEIDHPPQGYPPIRMRAVSVLADAVESLTARLEECRKVRNALIDQLAGRPGGVESADRQRRTGPNSEVSSGAKTI